MALDQFKPILWSRRFIVNVDEALVFKQVVDTSYEGEIRYGTSLKINEIGDITVSDYGSSDITYQELDDAQKMLVIDQKKYFAFQVDDADAVQMNVSVMNGAMQKSAFAVQKVIDSFIAGKYTEAGITNASNLGSKTTGLNLYAKMMPDLVTYMHRYLDEASAPEAGRWCVAPPWFMQLLKYSLIVTGATMLKSFDDPNAIQRYPGMPGMGFTWYQSNNVAIDTTNTEYAIMFGTRDAIAYAGQIEGNIEGRRLEKRFADGMRGLYVYGSKVVRPDHLGVIYANFTALTT